jgi:hypothetical protein
MPATVGTTLPSPAQFPLRHAGLGPFISSDGTIYFLGRRSTFTGQMGMFRTTDPMAGTWTEVAINPGIASTIEAGRLIRWETRYTQPSSSQPEWTITPSTA